jgi:hypothetical protein
MLDPGDCATAAQSDAGAIASVLLGRWTRTLDLAHNAEIQNWSWGLQ